MRLTFDPAAVTYLSGLRHNEAVKLSSRRDKLAVVGRRTDCRRSWRCAGSQLTFKRYADQGMIASRVITIAFASAILALPKIAVGQVPDGYALTTTIVTLPDSLVEVRQGGRFRVTVVRVARDSLEKTLIDTAERLIPHRDTIARAASTVRGGGHIQAVAEASRLPGDRWWWHEADGVLLPFALTGAAAEYYITHVRDLSSQPNPFARYRPGVLHTASVEYTARVVRTDVETTPIRVELKVRFEFYCGSTCALWFTHSRIVDFDVSGRAVRVTGDRPPAYGIS